MRHLPYRLEVRVASVARRFVISVVVLGTLLTSAPVHAAVPTYVVEIELNTKFERSLEKFLFDLFNTLQRREEDFTAAFELQKIEKAREDVNKLFQETQAELEGYGFSFDVNTNWISDTANIRDPRLTGGSTPSGQNCNDSPGISGTPPGCPPVISPIKDSRIVHDPYQYLFGDAATKAQLYTYCFYNYLIWDQWGRLPEHYPWLTEPIWRAKKNTYAPSRNYPQNTIASAFSLINERNTLVVQLARGNYYQLNNPFHELYGSVRAVDFAEVEPRCRQVMYIVGADSPITAEQKVNVWLALQAQNEITGIPPSDIDRFRRSLLNLPSLMLTTTSFSLSTAPNPIDVALSKDDENYLDGVKGIVLNEIERIRAETQTERLATYIAGQGIRPEQLYQTHIDSETGARFDINTEYIIAPAAFLLQKLQAATQAQFDLAGQGFLYLDAVSTPDDILDAYNLTRASSEEERKICNNAGACQLLDAWLKPAATFRSVATLHLDALNKTSPLIPQLIGPTGDYPGSGLPAPWEDAGVYLNIGGEKSDVFPDNRYTVARFLNEGGISGIDGQDEFDDPTFPNQDNLGINLPGADYPLNDYYDRVFEMYESGIGVAGFQGDSLRPNRTRQFTIPDWQCYISIWFFQQESVAINAPGSSSAAYFYGVDNIASEFLDRAGQFNDYCGTYQNI